MNNYPEGSMRGSGIYSESVSYEEFDCEGCGQNNPAGDVSTDDWGQYAIECEFCSATYRQSSVKEDYEDYMADVSRDYWNEERFERNYYGS